MQRNQARPVAFHGVGKIYGNYDALGSVDLAIAPGEFIALLGPSGSGKTTLLNIAAGFVAPSTGRVFIDGQDVTALPPRRRNIGMMFQSYALFPHLSVFENVAYGLRVRRRPKQEITERVNAALAMVQLGDFATRSIRQLSGGQQQRVALARAVVIEPDVLLMDEPLGALDRQLRRHMQLEIRRLHKSIGGTTIYVTHDQEEALVMADRIGVMRNGRIEQIGTPQELYAAPGNAFIASFLGESNLIEGRVSETGAGGARLDVSALGLSIAGRVTTPLRMGEPAAALLRPETLSIDPAGPLPGIVEEVVFLGEITATRVALKSGQSIWCRSFSSQVGPVEGQSTAVSFDPARVLVLPLSAN